MIASIYYVDEEHYDIKGTAYLDFIEKCFKLSSYFSLVSSRGFSSDLVEKNEYILNSLESFIHKSKQTLSWPGNIIYENNFPTNLNYNKAVTYNVYKCCKETQKILTDASESLFSWCEGRPEDLSFYYDTKKVFLYSVSHEGDCTISCTPEVLKEFTGFNFWKIDSQTAFIEELYF